MKRGVAAVFVAEHHYNRLLYFISVIIICAYYIDINECFFCFYVIRPEFFLPCYYYS